jgi:hypothetical protein
VIHRVGIGLHRRRYRNRLRHGWTVTGTDGIVGLEVDTFFDTAEGDERREDLDQIRAQRLHPRLPSPQIRPNHRDCQCGTTTVKIVR